MIAYDTASPIKSFKGSVYAKYAVDYQNKPVGVAEYATIKINGYLNYISNVNMNQSPY
jgi:hypothetical protein